MASWVYDEAANQLTTDGTIDWANDTIKARLVASSVTPARTDTVMTGYTVIGTDQTLGTKTKTKDGTNHRIVFSAANSTWSAVAGGSTIGWVVIFKFVTNDAASTPIALLDVTDTATNGGDVTVQYSASGIFYLQE
jgi:hypothetical protein